MTLESADGRASPKMEGFIVAQGFNLRSRTVTRREEESEEFEVGSHLTYTPLSKTLGKSHTEQDAGRTGQNVPIKPYKCNLKNVLMNY